MSSKAPYLINTVSLSHRFFNSSSFNLTKSLNLKTPSIDFIECYTMVENMIALMNIIGYMIGYRNSPSKYNKIYEEDLKVIAVPDIEITKPRTASKQTNRSIKVYYRLSFFLDGFKILLVLNYQQNFPEMKIISGHFTEDI